jgi:acetyltransferase-like isoleucine patch superfamily enzyme
MGKNKKSPKGIVMKYLIVDDLELKYAKIAPLRSQLDIRAGVLKLRQKIEGYLGIEEVYLIIDKHLEELYKERFDNKVINKIPQGDLCFVNGRLKINEELASLIDQQDNNTLLLSQDDEFISLKITSKEEESCSSQDFLNKLSKDIKKIKINGPLWSSIDEILDSLHECIRQDFQDFFYDKDNYSETELGVTVINPYDVWIGQDAILKHGSVLDASQGPIIIDEGAVIGLNSTIEGPAYIGKETYIQAGSNIKNAVSIGKKSNIGGEISACIFQAYASKPYKGSLNRCYIGEWTKFEAGLSIESDFFISKGITIIRDYSLSFSFSKSSEDNLCQYQEMRGSKLEILKFDKKVGFSKIEHELLKQYLNEEA